jgi:hypothetical protein
VFGELIVRNFNLVEAGVDMKLIAALMLLAVFGVGGCADGRTVLKKHDPQLVYRCDIDPYRAECVNK